MTIDNPKLFKEITEGMLVSNEDSINLDQADLKMVLSYKGLVLAAKEEYKGEDAPLHALTQALKSALKNRYELHNASAILMSFNIHPDAKMMDISNAVEIINDGANEDADIIFGTTTNLENDIDHVKVSIVLSGL